MPTVHKHLPNAPSPIKPLARASNPTSSSTINTDLSSLGKTTPTPMALRSRNSDSSMPTVHRARMLSLPIPSLRATKTDHRSAVNPMARNSSSRGQISNRKTPRPTRSWREHSTQTANKSMPISKFQRQMPKIKIHKFV